MEAKKGIRVLGGKNVRPTWERFNRLQKTAELVAGGVREPKAFIDSRLGKNLMNGKLKYQVQGGPQTKATS